jgi:hypothetical protein
MSLGWTEFFGCGILHGKGVGKSIGALIGGSGYDYFPFRGFESFVLSNGSIDSIM